MLSTRLRSVAGISVVVSTRKLSNEIRQFYTELYSRREFNFMKSLLLFCFVFLISITSISTIAASSVFAQEMDMPEVVYSEPQIVSGDSERCKLTTAPYGNQMAITFLNAETASQDSTKNSLKCRIEMNATMPLNKGWYLYSAENTVAGMVKHPPRTKAALTIQTTFQGKRVLQFRETKTNVLVTHSNSIPVSFAWSKKKQCSGTMQSVTGKIELNLDAQAQGNIGVQSQGDALANLSGFDVVLFPVRCDSQI
jgi:hypothetical protein